jgi:hypothetical protein
VWIGCGWGHYNNKIVTSACRENFRHAITPKSGGWCGVVPHRHRLRFCPRDVFRQFAIASKVDFTQRTAGCSKRKIIAHDAQNLSEERRDVYIVFGWIYTLLRAECPRAGVTFGAHPTTILTGLETCAARPNSEQIEFRSFFCMCASEGWI